MSAAFDRLVDRLTEHTGHAPKGGGRQRMARCPAHDDTTPSLSVTAGNDRVQIKCQAGCDTDAVLAALDLTRVDLYDECKAKGNRPTVIATYDYVDENGDLLYVVERLSPKGFRQKRPAGAGRWEWNLDGTRRVPYRLPNVVDAVRLGLSVYVVEGEKDVHAVEQANAVATCNAGGAGKWRPEFGDILAGANVIVVADRDRPGYEHARAVAADLARKASSVRLVEPAEGKDVSDHLAAGHGLDELVDLPVGAVGDGDDPADRPDDDMDNVVEQEKRRQWARREAIRQLDEEDAARTLELPPSTLTLAEELVLPDRATVYTIDPVLPSGGNVLLASRYKAGKTTLQANLLRSLVDAEPFLGTYPVRPLAGRVGFLNYELDRDMFRRWLRDVGVQRPGRASVLNLRGYRLPLTTKAGETALVGWLQEREVEVLIVDPFARASAGQAAENANDEVGMWLDTLDVIKRRAGVTDLILSTHFGRAEHVEGDEHARGATRLDDWCDVRWLLTVDDSGARYFRATGRDVDEPEARLDYEAVTRRLTLAGGSRADMREEAVVQLVVDVVTATPGITANKIEAAIDEPQHAVRAARARAIEAGLVRTEDGPNRSKLHHPAPGESGALQVRQRTQGAVRQVRSSDAPPPTTETASGSNAPDLTHPPYIRLVQEQLGGQILSDTGAAS